MAHPPVTKRHIPMTLRAWQAELSGLTGFRDKQRRYIRSQGPKWLRRYLDYVELRIEDLLDNAPEVAVKRGLARHARADYEIVKR